MVVPDVGGEGLIIAQKENGLPLTALPTPLSQGIEVTRGTHLYTNMDYSYSTRVRAPDSDTAVPVATSWRRASDRVV